MKKSYFTFGQNHTHSVNGMTWDKDIIVEIEAEDPRKVMFDTFGHFWGHEYDNPPDLRHFPRGVKRL